MKATARKFIKDTQKEMEEAGVTVQLDKDSKVVTFTDGGMPCNGYFSDAEPLTFACAMGKPFEQWFPIYVHEYAHFTQWREQADVWEEIFIGDLSSDDFVEQWIESDKKFPRATVDKFIDVIIAVESDCDRRAMALIEKHNLPLDLDYYAQTANAYSHFYNYVKVKRKWYSPGKVPYEIPEIVSQMNTTIDDEFLVSHEYMDLFTKYC